MISASVPSLFRKESSIMKPVISDAIVYIGVSDHTIDLFENQYPVPNGMAYNSYVILDDHVAVMDTADVRVSEAWRENLSAALGDRTPDYLIVSHMEPDHCANIAWLAEQCPDMKIVGNVRTFPMLKQFFGQDYKDRAVLVKDGDILSLGTHTLQFFTAPMVHWPEVMVTYEQSEKVLFSADAFGKFGALDVEEDWTCEARRYYFNIVGKYGIQVQALLKKAAPLSIQTICPLHGPILKENLGFYLEKYQTWSSYQPEEEGVFIAYASIHGHTKEAALLLESLLKEAGAPHVSIADLSRADIAECVEDAFRYSHLVLCSSSYDGGIFPPMEDFLHHLQAKAFQNRKVALVENGSWAPSAGRGMKAILDTMKDLTICPDIVTIRSALSPESEEGLRNLSKELLAL